VVDVLGTSTTSEHPSDSPYTEKRMLMTSPSFTT